MAPPSNTSFRIEVLKVLLGKLCRGQTSILRNILERESLVDHSGVWLWKQARARRHSPTQSQSLYHISEDHDFLTIIKYPLHSQHFQIVNKTLFLAFLGGGWGVGGRIQSNQTSHIGFGQSAYHFSLSPSPLPLHFDF